MGVVINNAHCSVVMLRNIHCGKTKEVIDTVSRNMHLCSYVVEVA
jgi:hypothetical protein